MKKYTVDEVLSRANEYGNVIFYEDDGEFLLPEGLKVGGSLYLSGTQIRELPEGLKVGGWLYLSGTQIRELPEGLKVGGWLDLSGTQIRELPEGLKVGGWLYLSGTQIRELPEGLKVGGGLDLSGTQIRELPEGLKVGGSLYLSGTQIRELPEGLKVGGWLDLSGTQIKKINRNLYRFHDPEYVENDYLYADGILTFVKEKIEKRGYVFYVGEIDGKNVVSDGENYAHCNNFSDGIEDLKFKAAKERGAESYKNISLDVPIPTDEAIQMYRVITGACREGTRSFCDNLTDIKETYTIREISKITEGAYGNGVFKRFFSIGEET